MIDKSVARPSESMGRDLDFYSIYTKFNIIPTGDYRDNAQRTFDTLVSLVSFRAQPVINGEPFYVSDLANEGAEQLTGDGYVWKFAVEHTEIFALHDDNFEIVDDVHFLKVAFDDVEIGEDNIFVDGDEINIEFRRFESL